MRDGFGITLLYLKKQLFGPPRPLHSIPKKAFVEPQKLSLVSSFHSIGRIIMQSSKYFSKITSCMPPRANFAHVIGLP